jgi:nucleoid-associated protein YgaU
MAPKLPLPPGTQATNPTPPIGSLPAPYVYPQITNPVASVVPPEPSPTIPRHPGNSGSAPGNFGNGAGNNGTTIQLTKPPSSPPPTLSTAIERTPTTSYDVDLYELKQGDTWESISKEFYNDTRYAAALKAVNLNKSLTSGGAVDIPPLYILKQKIQTPPRSGTPISQSSPIPSSAPTWGPPAGATTPAAPSGGSQIYKVPPGGTSMRDIAKNYLGNEQRWMEIYNLNPQITAPNAIPAGTEVKLPLDARLP